MATEREVIKSFLVSLGFQIDTGGLNKFTGALLNACKTAGKITGTLAGVTVAAEALVQVFAHSMEKLFYASNRTKASVENIQAIGFAFKQIGLSEEEALASLENFSRGLRTNPGLMALLKNLGVKAEGRDRVVVMTDLVKRLSAMPHYVGSQFAEMFGMDEQTFYMMKEMLPQLEAAQERRRAMNRAAGVDAQAAAKASQEYSNAIRDLWGQVGVLSDKLAIELMPEFKKVIGWANENLPIFTGYVIEVGKALGAWKTTDFSPKYLTGFVLEQLDLWQRWLDLIDNVKGALLKFTPAGMAAGMIERFQSIMQLQAAASQGGSVAGRGASGTIGSGSSPSSSSVAGGKTPLGIRQNNPGNLRSWGSALVQNGFAAFATEQEGLSAMAGNLLAYSKQGINTVRGIIGRWAPPSENDTGAYTNFVSKRLGVDPNEQLNMRDPQAMAALMDAIINKENGYNPYSRADLLGAAQGRIGGGDRSVVINQKTDIHIASTDPASAGRAVAAEQGRVNSDLTRNNVSQIR